MSNLEIRALALFDSYIDMDEPRRAGALAELKAQDPALHDELLGLLKADTRRSLLERTPFDVFPPASQSAPAPGPDPRIGGRLGPWRIESVIGSGGMGTVYLAQRADGQYEQTVALKCLRAGIHSPQLEAAFRQERAILAQLDHPNIARLVDGGIDANGHPWFAMQKVDGQPIDRWCDQHHLPLRERVQLLIQACAAVSHAHGQGVLHQDIKPSNLLVGDDGRPMLLDFGLTELLSQDRHQRRDRIAMSSGYTAPEALRETRPSVTNDIYAMGVVLYRLLCADWPVAQANHAAANPLGPAEPCQPRAPSALARQATGHVVRVRGAKDAKSLSRQLKGDLDSIALRCVAIDPDDRYGSIDALQADLQRRLEHRPVQSYNGGAAYRLRKFIRRNALATTLALVSMLSLGMVAGFGLWQAQQAREDSALTLALTQTLERIPGGAMLPEWGEMPLNSRDALKKSEAGLRRSPLSTNPRALTRGLLTLARGHIVIGNYPHASGLVEEARRLAPGDPQSQAWAQATLAALHNAQANYARAEQIANEGIRELGTPLTGGEKTVLAGLNGQIARARWQMADHAAARTLLDDTLRAIEANPKHYPRQLLAKLLTLRSDWNNQLRRFEDGRADAERAIGMLGTSSAHTQEQLISALRESGDAEKGLEAAEENLRHQQRQFGVDHPETGFAWILLAEARQASGDPSQALQASRQAQRILASALGPEHPYISRALRIGALAQAFGGEHQAAVNDAHRALSIMEMAYGPRHYQTILSRQVLAVSLGHLSQSSGQQRYLDQALSQYARLLRDGEALGLPMGRQWLAYGIRLANSGRTAEARQALQRALPLLEQEGSKYVFEVHRNMAVVALKEHRHDEARALLEASATQLRAPADRSLYRLSALSDTLLDLAQLELELDRPEPARQHLQEALHLNRQAFGDKDPQVHAIQLTLESLAEDAP